MVRIDRALEGQSSYRTFITFTKWKSHRALGVTVNPPAEVWGFAIFSQSTPNDLKLNCLLSWSTTVQKLIKFKRGYMPSLPHSSGGPDKVSWSLFTNTSIYHAHHSPYCFLRSSENGDLFESFWTYLKINILNILKRLPRLIR